MVYRGQHVIFRKHVKYGDVIVHLARIITYVDIKKGKAKLVSLLTNDMEMEAEDIVAIYRKRWEMELLFKPGHHVPYHAHVQCQLLHVFRTARERLDQNHRSRVSAT